MTQIIVKTDDECKRISRLAEKYRCVERRKAHGGLGSGSRRRPWHLPHRAVAFGSVLDELRWHGAHCPTHGPKFACPWSALAQATTLICARRPFDEGGQRLLALESSVASRVATSAHPVDPEDFLGRINPNSRRSRSELLPMTEGPHHSCAERSLCSVVLFVDELG